jgi:archaellum component FlaC
MFPTDEDIDTKALSSLTEVLQSIADSDDDVTDANKRLANSLKTETRTAEDIAESILRFDDAIQDVTDNYDKWMKAL